MINKKEKTQNKKTKSNIIVILLIIAIIAAGILSYYAYSKYTSTLTGNGTATVAKWSFKVNGQTEQFDTINLAETLDEAYNIAEGRIAPGTSGRFDLNIDGTGSEVAIEYTITLGLSEKPQNLTFYSDSSYTTPIPTTGDTATVKGYINLNDASKMQTKTIYWKWPYEIGETQEEKDENNAKDLADSGKTCNIPVTVTGVQRNTSEERISQGAITVVSPTTGEYKAGQEIVIQAEYSEPVYGGANSTTITAENAPVMAIKFGTGTAKTMAFKQVSGNAIQYTYTLEADDEGALAIQSYTGTVYNEKGESIAVETKTVEGNSITVKNTENLADVVSVGDYVNYHANDNGSYSYTTDSTLTGSTTASTFSSSDTMQWRVLSVDKEAGTVELMSADPTSQTVEFGTDGDVQKCQTAFTNAETVLNDIGAVYGHGKGAKGGRSITVEDVQQYSSYNPYTYANNNSSTGYYGGTREHTSGTFYKEVKDEKGNVTGYETSTTTASSTSPVTMTQTYYYYEGQSYFENSTAYNMIFKQSTNTSANKPVFWLASRCVDLGSSYTYYNVRVVGFDMVDNRNLFTSSGKNNSPAFAMSAVVSLKSNIQTSGQDESGAWNLVIE